MRRPTGKWPRRRVLSPPAYGLIKGGLVLSCALLAASLALVLHAGPLSAHNVHIHRLAADLYRAPLGVLLLTHLGALLVEERLS